MTRPTLHRVATHVLARRRYDVSGRFGLRATPGGFGTPAFGADVETIRVAGASLVREVGGSESRRPIAGSTLRELALFVDADIDADFSAGDDAPPPGDVDHPLDVDVAIAARLADWYALGWRALDVVVEPDAGLAEVAVIQLWPEHFDAGTTLTIAPATKVNLGFSPGDSYEPEPYLYVGPWDAERRGDPSYWNAPFGASRRADSVLSSAHPLDTCVEFLHEGLRNATGG